MQQHAIHALNVRAPMSSLSQIPSWRSRHVNATFVRDRAPRRAANAAARATMIATMTMREHTAHDDRRATATTRRLLLPLSNYHSIDVAYGTLLPPASLG
jgi:hypothetical protein